MPTHQIVDVLADNLTSRIATLSSERYGGPIFLRRMETIAQGSSAVLFQLEGASLSPLEAHVTVRHVGGNMYDLVCSVDGGPSQLFTYSLPTSTPLLVPQAPHLAQKVATFLLDAIERRLGHEQIRNTLQSKKTPGSMASAR